MYLIKELYPEYIKDSYKAIIKDKNSILKWTKYLNRYFPKEDKHMKRCSVSLVLGKCKSNPQRYYFIFPMLWTECLYPTKIHMFKL